MTQPKFDVLGIGNAIVDIISRTEDDFLLRHEMRKGGMALIDEHRAGAIYEAMGPAVEISGGSAANTIVGVASLGGRAAFVGKVKDDELGRAFRHDIRAAGVPRRICIRTTSTPMRSPPLRSPTSKVICGTRRTPRTRSLKPRASPMRRTASSP
jgi:sugar/nucleoside kinase (ribokinase family)